MNKEEVDRHLLILDEAGKAFNTSQKAMLRVSRLDYLDIRESLVMKYWRMSQQAEREYNTAVNWLNQHNIPFIYSKEQERYVEVTLSPS
jgi:hypothetical protein